MTEQLTLPKDFLWGVAGAAHQVEGNNVNSDGWLLEHVPGTPFAEPSGDACDHYHRYPDDIAMIASLGFNSYRFSLEWARIEPEEGEFSLAALEHYRRMLVACHEHHLLPIVTYNHFTCPRWFAAKGGWEVAANAAGILPPEAGVELTQMGYEFWPEALEATIRYTASYTGRPVLVTENGIGTSDDTRRIEFVRRALLGVERCIQDGITVKGYCYWSVFDNFEWALGYRPTFGLIAVDRQTQVRTPKPSATWLGHVARTRML